MKFEDICDAVVARFEGAIKSPEGLSNLSPGDAVLLGSAILGYRVQQMEVALQDLTAALAAGQPPPSELTGEMLRSADAMARGARPTEPVVRVDMIPPGDNATGGK